MQQAEFNHNDFTNTSEADKALLVRFFYKNVQNKLESAAQNRPIFKEKTYIEIRIAGQRDAQACRPATHQDKQRFPLHFEAFEKRVEPPAEGLPLTEWPKITRSQAEELTFLSVKTVEQLAGMKDTNASKIMGGYKLVEDAKKWLAQNNSDVEDAEKAELRAQVADLTAKVAKLLAATEAGKGTQAPEKVELTSKLDEETEVEETVVEGAAIEVPAAPAARRKRTKKA